MGRSKIKFMRKPFARHCEHVIFHDCLHTPEGYSEAIQNIWIATPLVAARDDVIVDD